ncbi:MAG: hypothetical protein QMD12_00425 [Candidatus Aenigmarchaeota archaeon]|nr:hypothetical protein [Candidatus Aenigmarchaeota archaeon]
MSIEDKDVAVKRIGRAIRRYYFEVLDKNTLKLKDGSATYRWDKNQEDFPNLTLFEAVKKLTEGISRYVVERTSSMDWKRAEKLFSGYNFPYEPGIGRLAAAFPEGLVQIIGRIAVPTHDIISFLKRFYLNPSIDRGERLYYLNLIKKIEESKIDHLY